MALFEKDRLMVRGVFDGKYRIVEVGVNPYAFIEPKGVARIQEMTIDIQPTDLKSEDGKDVFLFRCRTPVEVGAIRRLCDEWGIETYEADIPFLRRILIDRVYSVDYSGSRCYIDIELDDRNGIPTKYGETEIVSVGVMSDAGDRWFYYEDYDSEKDMLIDVMRYFRENSLTVFVGWNVGFDYNHLLERGKVLGVDVAQFELSHDYDLLSEYRRRVKGLTTYSLASVAEHEKLEGKIERGRIYDMSRSELEEYNMRDVLLVKEIDERYGFTDLSFELAKEIGLTLDMLSPVKISDTLILRRIRELGRVARNWIERPKQKYEGALVRMPVPGLHKHVVVFDFSSMYPSIIINKNVDVNGFNGAVLPYIERKLIDKRKEYKEKYKASRDKSYDIKQQVYKQLSNIMYGVFGMPYFRYYNPEKAELITRTGRELITEVGNFVEELGFEVIYGDTDSIFVKIDGTVKDIEKGVEWIEKIIQEVANPYSVKVDYFLDKVIFFGKEGKGTKKRYIGKLHNSNEYVVRGVEMRRKDWCMLAKKVMKEVVDMVFEGKSLDEVYEYLNNIRARLYRGEFDKLLIINKSVKELSEYKSNQPHVRALRMAIDMGRKVLDGTINYVYVGRGKVKPVFDDDDLENLAYGWYWRHQIYPPVKRVIDSAYSYGKQTTLF